MSALSAKSELKVAASSVSAFDQKYQELKGVRVKIEMKNSKAILFLVAICSSTG